MEAGGCAEELGLPGCNDLLEGDMSGQLSLTGRESQILLMVAVYSCCLYNFHNVTKYFLDDGQLFSAFETVFLWTSIS